MVVASTLSMLQKYSDFVIFMHGDRNKFCWRLFLLILPCYVLPVILRNIAVYHMYSRHVHQIVNVNPTLRRHRLFALVQILYLLYLLRVRTWRTYVLVYQFIKIHYCTYSSTQCTNAVFHTNLPSLVLLILPVYCMLVRARLDCLTKPSDISHLTKFWNCNFGFCDKII